MTTYNTGNPIGSTDARDLYDNAQALDQAVNGSGTYTDRLGHSHRTLSALEDEFPNAAANAATATTQAGVATTQAGVATEQASAATTAKTAAESARDAALIQAGVYVDEPTGRAAVANGVAFKVQGSGDVAAYEYRRTNSTTSALIATYPAASAIGKAISANRTSVDLLTSYTWTNGLLKTDGTTFAYAGYLLSPFIPVVPKVSFIKMLSGPSYGAGFVNIVGYDANNQFVSVLASNNSLLSPVYVEIPDGVYFVRLCDSTSTLKEAKAISITELASDSTYSKYLKSSQVNLLGSGLAYYQSNNTAAPGGVFQGTGYVPFAPGDTIIYRLNAYAQYGGVGLFDSSFNFVRQIAGTVGIETEYKYSFDPIRDAGAAYLVASNANTRGKTGYLYKYSSTEFGDVKYKAIASLQDNMSKRGKVYLQNYSNTTVASNTISFGATPNYVFVLPDVGGTENHSALFVAVKLRLDSLGGGQTSATLSWYSNSVKSASKTFAVGDTLLMWAKIDDASQNFLSCTASNAVFTVMDSLSFGVRTSFYNTWSLADTTSILEDENIFTPDYYVANYAIKNYSSSAFKNKKLVIFGDSIMLSSGPNTIPVMTSNAVQMTLVNLAQSGSTLQSNLSDTNLALIPVDAALVVIGGGANGGGTDAGSISSRDRATIQGVLNYAIDWIYSNRPGCRILLLTPIQRSSGSQTVTPFIRQIAAYRGVPLADADLNAEVSPSTATVTLYDGLHPSNEGVKRCAGVLTAAIRNIGY